MSKLLSRHELDEIERLHNLTKSKTLKHGLCTEEDWAERDMTRLLAHIRASTEVFVVFQRRPEIGEEYTEYQGTFSEEELADKQCLDERYYYWKFILNEEFSHETTTDVVHLYKYPRISQDWFKDGKPTERSSKN